MHGVYFMSLGETIRITGQKAFYNQMEFTRKMNVLKKLKKEAESLMSKVEELSDDEVKQISCGNTLVQFTHEIGGFLLPVITFIPVLLLLNKTENK